MGATSLLNHTNGRYDTVNYIQVYMQNFVTSTLMGKFETICLELQYFVKVRLMLCI